MIDGISNSEKQLMDAVILLILALTLWGTFGVLYLIRAPRESMKKPNKVTNV